MLEIRPMRHQDMEAVASLLVVGFRSKLIALKKWDDSRIESFINDAYFVNPNNLKSYIIAEIDGRVAGVLCLATKESEKIKSPDPRKGFIRRYGLFRSLYTWFSLSFLRHTIKADELYIDFIVVGAGYRGHGIGRTLINHVYDQSLKDSGKSYLTLSVIFANTKAYKLYERLGFQVTKTQSLPILGRLVGIKGHYFMKKI